MSEKEEVQHQAAEECAEKVCDTNLCDGCGRKRPRAKRPLTDEARSKLSERAKTSAWAQHVAQFRKDHPEVKGRQVFSEAKKTYKKAEVKSE